MKKAVSSLGLLIALSPFAMAQDNSNFYLGTRIGASILDGSCATIECTSKEVGAGFIGGYDFANGFSIETTYDYLGRLEIREQIGINSILNSGETTMFTLAPKFNFGITQNTSIFAKVGASWWDWNSGTVTSSDLSLLTALGLEHRANSNVNLRLEYQYTPEMGLGSVGSIPSISANHHYVTAGITFHFGRKSAPIQTPVEDNYLVEENVYDSGMIEEDIIIESEQVIVNQASDEASFDFGKSQLSASALNSLDPILKRLQEYSQATATIIGNTDKTGPEAFNQILSVQRAQSVADYFNSNGINSDRMTVTGRGSSDPIATNDTLEGRAMNRRVAIESPEFILEQQ